VTLVTCALPQPNDKRSHAGSVTPGSPRDKLPALAAAMGSAGSQSQVVSDLAVDQQRVLAPVI